MADVEKKVVVTFINKGTDELGRKINGMSKKIKETVGPFTKITKVSDRYDKSTGELKKRITTMTSNFRSFKMELLSVMFFGMGIQRFFLGMLQPALQAVGVFQLWNAMLTIFFLPTALQLLNWVINFFTWVTELPPGVQNFINILVALGVVLGTALMVIGAMGLGLSGLSTWWITLGPAITSVGSIITGVASIFGGLIPFIAIMLALIVVFASAWKENFAGIREVVMKVWEGIKMAFSGIINIIKGIIDIFIGFFSGDTRKIKDGFWKLIDGIVQLFIGLPQAVFGILITLGIVVFKAIWNIIKSVWSLGVELVTSIIDGIKSMGGALAKAFWDILPDWVKNLVTSVAGAAKSLLSSIFSNTPPVPMAMGGIVTSPTVAMIGEAGPEAVVPLSGPNAFGGMNFAPTINVYGATNLDIDRLKDQLSRQWYNDLKNMVRYS